MNRRLVAAVAVTLILAGCGENTVTPDPRIPVGPIDPYADPPDYSGDPFADFPEVTGVTIPSGQVLVVEEEVLSGTHYTIQISAATTEEAAVRLAESVDAEITQPVFVDREGSYWKVRVGAFPAQQDAVNYSQTLIEMGFTDAWVTTRQP